MRIAADRRAASERLQPIKAPTSTVCVHAAGAAPIAIRSGMAPSIRPGLKGLRAA
jgi:hypothetical protein